MYIVIYKVKLHLYMYFGLISEILFSWTNFLYSVTMIINDHGCLS